MEKQSYKAPVTEIIRFETEDVITASGGNIETPIDPMSLN